MMEERDEFRGSRQRLYSRAKRRRGLLLAAAALTALGAGAFFFYRLVYRVEPAFSTVVYELGQEVSSDVGDYLIGTDWSVGTAQLDLSEVDESRAGSYQAVVHHGSSAFQYEIVIQDTAPPKILSAEGPVYLALGREYGTDALIAGVEDRDSQVQLGFPRLGGLAETVQFDEEGSYLCAVAAEDSSGNRSLLEVPVTVDRAPEITGAQDFYVALGSRVDFLEQVEAFDERDGDLTGRLAADDGGVELDRPGVYSLTYHVQDNLGIETEEQVQVTVASREELQEMIGSRRVDRHRARVIGAINPYDSGASDREDLNEALEYVRPALVQLYYDKGNGGYSAGSGYIMEITDDTIYICSNRHVVEIHDVWEVYFCDGTRAKGVPVGVSDEFDVGVVAVDRDNVPKELTEKLMTVHIDQEYWSGLDDQRIDVGLERVDREGGILRISTGTLVKVKQHFTWYDQKDHTEVTLKLDHGDSGSAVLDGRGNMIGMAFAYSESPRRYWCIPLDGVVECYEEITGRELFVY